MGENNPETENKLIKKLICGDNLVMMQRIDSDSVDLAYIDPPFFTNRDFAVIWNDGSEIRSFKDRWIVEKEGKKATKDIYKYIDWMEARIKEIHRILKPTGSFYLHCDDNAVHYLKILCDKIFGDNRFINQIQWKRTFGAKTSSKSYADNTDYILYYLKNTKYTFNVQYLPLSQDTIERDYKMLEVETGRRFAHKQMDKRGDKIYTLDFGKDRGIVTAPKGFGFTWTQSTLDERIKANPYLIYWTKKGRARYKKYLDEHLGVPVDNMWTDIPPISAMSKERKGYPTQKPEALLERIIKTSSNKGDLVLDAFGGTGTTAKVCQDLNRGFISIDVSPTACRVQAERLNISVEKIQGMPLNTEDVGKLDGWEFQNYVIHLLDPNNKRGIKVHGRGADGGIDGFIYNIPIEVKKHKSGTGRKDLDSFSGVLRRERKTKGVFIALKFTTGFYKEVSRLNTEDQIKIYMFTLDDIIKGKHKELVAKFRNEKNDFMNF